MNRRQQSHLARGGLVACVILVGVAFFLLAQTLPNISDTIGYVYAGQRLASGEGLTYSDENNRLVSPYYSLYAFQIRRADDLRMYLGFPPGFPILLAGAIELTGQPEAIHYVVPLMAALGLVATFCLGTLVSKSEWTGLWAVALLALAPIYWEYGTASWSEIPSLAFVTAGVCFHILSQAEKRPRWQATVLQICGGGLISFSFFIRYANVIVVPALLVCKVAMADRQRLKERQTWPFWSLVALGLVAIPVFNQLYYGGALLTSYSPEHGWYPWSAFSPSYALGPSPVNGYSLIEALKTLWENYPGLLLAVPVGWLLLDRRWTLLIAGIPLGLMALYSFYAFAPTGVNSRFLLPVFPFLCVAIAQTISFIGKRFLNQRQRWVMGMVMAVMLCLPIPARVGQLRSRNLGDAAMVETMRSMTASTPGNAVFLSYVYNDQIAFYGGRSVLNYRRIPPSDPETGRYRMETFEQRLVQSIDQLLAGGIPVYYVEDKSPPFWDSLAILQRHFKVELVSHDLKVFVVHPLVQPDGQTAERVH
jgi:4-amino-4-deoxy-L-arabinose transferase-like glycosyltransferase